MKIKVVKDKKELGNFVSDIVCKIIKEKNEEGEKAVLGLATGTTPIPVYEELVRRYNNGDVDFFNTVTFNLDEYINLPQEDKNSYHTFMNENFIEHININKNNVHIPDGNAEDLEEEVKNYERILQDSGYQDLQILGIGHNGHIGFNEPGEFLLADTGITHLTNETIKANSRFFENINDVPKDAITMGMRTILNADKIVLMITGESKKEIAAKMLKQEGITSKYPATLLYLHPDLTLVLDEEAYNAAQEIINSEV